MLIVKTCRACVFHRACNADLRSGARRAVVGHAVGGSTESSAPSPPLATGASPLRCWGSSHRNSPRSALGDLQPFCHALAWALEVAAHKAALPSEAFSVAAVVVKLGRLLQGLLASLRGTAPVVELLGLLGPSLAQLLGSSLAIKLEGAWSALCSLLSGAGPWDESQLLGCLSASLEAALGQPRPGPIRDRALHLWQSLFTRLTPATKAQLPPSLREVLRKVKPSLVPVPAELSQDSLVPDACLPSTPPKKEALSFSPLALPSKGGRRTLAPSPSKSKRPSGVGSPAMTTPTTRKRRSLYDFRAEEFVEVVSPIKKQQVLTEHQREVRKERRSLPALYSNLSQSNLDSHDQDSEDTPQSEEMDAKEPTWAVPGETKPNGLPAPAQQSSASTLSNPVIIVDSDSGEENEPLSSFTSAALLASREACRTPPLQELQPQNTAGADAMGTTVVPETQQDDTAPLLETPKARQQEHGSPPPSGAGGASNGSSRPPRWAVSSVGSPAALSRSRIMVDAARRNSAGGLSPSSRHSPSHNGGPPRPSPRPPAGILKRPPADGNSPQPKEPEAMDEGELVDSQLAVFPALEGCTESVNAVLPFLASSLWQSTLGRRLRQQGLCTVGQLASLTAAQVLQLPLRTPKVASLRAALQQYADSRGEAEESPLPPATAPTTQAAEVCNGLADSPEVELCDLTGGPAAAPSAAATPSLDLEEDEALPCGQATGQEGDVAEESAAVTAVESVAASLVFSGPSPQTAEPKTLHSNAVQCKPSTTVVASQTGPVVLSKEEVCQLLTSDFFASLERVDLGRILATIATVVAADRQTTAGFL